jgi:hypothetical protein
MREQHVPVGRQLQAGVAPQDAGTSRQYGGGGVQVNEQPRVPVPMTVHGVPVQTPPSARG